MSVTFNGHDLTTSYSIDYRIERGLPEWQPSLIEAPARNGAIYAGTRAQPAEITMRLVPTSTDRALRQQALRTLAGWLAVSEPKVLNLGDEGGLYRMAVPTGEAEIEPYIDADVVEVTFVCPDPRLYGESKSTTVGTSAKSVTIGGTAPTALSVTVTATPNSSGEWCLTNSTTGDYMLVRMTTGSSHAVVIDCAARSVTVDGTVNMLTPDSDWLTPAPGTYSLKVTKGSGTSTVAWREMWW